MSVYTAAINAVLHDVAEKCESVALQSRALAKRGLPDASADDLKSAVDALEFVRCVSNSIFPRLEKAAQIAPSKAQS